MSQVNEWHFVKHFERGGIVYGCLWRGEKPEAWGVANLVQLTAEQFRLFKKTETVRVPPDAPLRVGEGGEAVDLQTGDEIE